MHSRIALASSLLALAPAGAGAATLPFADGFEPPQTGFSNWTTTRLDGGNALTQSTAQGWDGTQSLRFSYAGNAASVQAAAVVDFAASTSTAFVRTWLYVPSGTATLMGGNTAVRIVRLGDAVTFGGSGGTARVNLLLKLDSGGTLYLILEYADSGGTLRQLGSTVLTPITEATWHLVEFGYEHLANRARIYVDDPVTPKLDANPPPFALGTWTLLTCWVGLADAADPQGSAVSLSIDNVRVGTAQAGTSGSTAQHFNEIESGTLTVTSAPPGKAASTTSSAGVAIAASTAASHRGSFGSRVTDSDGSAGAGSGAAQVVSGTAVSTGTVYRRLWWRPSAPNGLGARTVFSIGNAGLAPAGNCAGYADLAVAGDGTVRIAGFDAASACTQAVSTSLASANAWHLIELVATGLGTSAGARKAYLDGALAVSQSGINWAGIAVDRVSEGQVWSGDRAYQGTDDFDDIRTSLAMMPSRLTVTAPAMTDQSCSAAITVSAVDSDGSARGLAEPTTVALQATGVSGSWYGDATCSTAVSSLAMAVGTSSATAYFKPTSAGPASLRATDLDYLSPPTSVAVASIATQLAFSTLAQTVVAGSCSGLTTVQSRDVGGNPATVASPTAVGLTSPSGTLAFFSDLACTSAITGVTIPTGQSSASFYFKDTTAGSPVLNAAATGLTGASQAQTVVPATPTKLVIISPPRTVVAGVCSAGVTVQSQDTYGNPSSVSTATTVNLSSSSSAATFFIDSSCASSSTTITLSSGTSSTSFYFMDTKSGTPTLTAGSALLVSGSQAETVNPAPPAKLVFTTLPQSAEADICSGVVTAQTQDVHSNPSPVTSTTSLSLSSVPPNVTFYSSSTCPSPGVTTLTMATGTANRNFYFKSTVAGAPTITVASPPLSSASQTETITPGPPSQIAFTSTALTVTAGLCSAAATVQSQDPFKNPSPVAADTAVALSSSAPTTAFHASAGCGAGAVTGVTILAGSTTASLYFRDTTAGTPTFTAGASGKTAGTQTQTVQPAPPSQLGFATPPRTVVAGTCSAPITVESRDPYGNPSNVVSATPVSVATSATATGKSYADASCLSQVSQVTILAGASAATAYYRDTEVGTPTLTASNPGLSSPTQGATIEPAAPSKLVFTSPAQTLVAGDCSAVATVQIQDAFDNPSPAVVATTVSLLSSSATTEFHLDAACASPATSVPIAPGADSASLYFRDPKTGSATLTARRTGVADGNQTAVFNTGPPVKLAFATPPRTVVAGRCSAVITVQSQDLTGNPASLAADRTVALSISSTTASLYGDVACAGAPVTGVTIAAGSSGAALFVKDPVTGTATLAASANGFAGASQTVTVVADLPSKLVFVTGPQTLTAGDCSAAVTVEVQDALSNAASFGAATAVSLRSTSPGATFHAVAGCTTAAITAVPLPAGASRVTFHFKDTRAGSPRVEASAGGVETATQVHTIQPGTPVRLAFATPTQTITATTCSNVATVESRDVLDNPSAVAGAARLSLASSSATGSFYSDVWCATPAVELSLRSGESAVDFYFKDLTPGAATLTVSTLGLSNATQAANFLAPQVAVKLVFATAPQTVDAGKCSGQAVVHARDAAGNAAPVSQATTVSLSSPSPAVTFHGDATCGVGVTSVLIPLPDYRARFWFKDAIVEKPAVRVAASGLTGAEQAQTVICPTTVDGAACDDADLCNGRETCRSGVCRSGTTPNCDDNDRCTADSCDAARECVYDVDPVCCRAPKFAEANLAAAVGVPYRYSPSGQAVLRHGTGPLTWSACDTPPSGFHLDAVTAQVDWTPSVPGPQPLCLRVVGGCRPPDEDTYRFTVEVQSAPPAKPTALMALSRKQLAVGESLDADGRGSTGTAPLRWEWTFGDGTPPSHDDKTQHAYRRGGSYRVRLRVYDAVGQAAEAADSVTVGDPGCPAPPAVRIVADALAGPEPLAVEFRAEGDVSDPGAVVLWDFGDGNTGRGRTASHAFAAGAFRVRLRVATAEGCRAEDEVGVRVSAAANQPPSCRVSAQPIAGPAPLTVGFAAVFGDSDGRVASAVWSFSDGIKADALQYDGQIRRTLEAAGALTGAVTAIDEGGLSCRAAVTVEASTPSGIYRPAIVTDSTLGATCGEAYRYGDDGRARATGTPPIAWSLGKGGSDVGRPEDMTLDGSTGAIAWTPPKGKAGPVRVTIVAENEAGVDEQDFEVTVECAGAGGCGCGAGGGETAAVLALFAAWRRRRYRP